MRPRLWLLLPASVVVAVATAVAAAIVATVAVDVDPRLGVVVSLPSRT